MTPNTQTCEPERLEHYLSGKLSSDEETQLLSHLDDCELCRLRLDAIAAAPDAWQNAHAFLTDDELDQFSLTSIGDEDANSSPQIDQVLATLQPTDDPAKLGRIGGYEVSGVVGAGGMGVVLKAFDGPLDRTVAIKVMAPHLATSGAARQRFAREAKAAAAVIHPNVIAIHGVSTDAALPFLVMPYVGGASLQKRLDDLGPLPVGDILQISVQIASGLAAAHDQGLVHRDIKPANILLDNGIERLVITDFGLARAVNDASVTRTGVIAGTPQYMSPEQARGDAVDSRSDLFSLGSVMYTMCTGRVPFRADSPYGILRRITDTAPRPIQEINPDIPAWLCRIVEQLHCKLPSDRFESAHVVEELLTRCIAHLSQPAANPLPVELKAPHAALRIVKHWWKPTAFVAAATLLLLTTFSGQEKGQPPSPIISTEPPSAARGLPAPTSAEGLPVSSDQATPPPDAIFPWDFEQKKDEWNDNLDSVFLHIEQSLNKMATP